MGERDESQLYGAGEWDGVCDCELAVLGPQRQERLTLMFAGELPPPRQGYSTIKSGGRRGDHERLCVALPWPPVGRADPFQWSLARFMPDALRCRGAIWCDARIVSPSTFSPVTDRRRQPAALSGQNNSRGVSRSDLAHHECRAKTPLCNHRNCLGSRPDVR